MERQDLMDMALQKTWCGYGREISPAAECSSVPHGVALASAELTYDIVMSSSLRY